MCNEIEKLEQEIKLAELKIVILKLEKELEVERNKNKGYNWEDYFPIKDTTPYPRYPSITYTYTTSNNSSRAE